MAKESGNEPKPDMMPLAKGRITNWHLQQMKEKGEKISMFGNAMCDPLWAASAEASGVTMVRYLAPGETQAERDANIFWHTRLIRKMAPCINLNAVMGSQTYADKYGAVKHAATLMADGADNVLCMAITNDTLKYMSDNWIPVFGHVGVLSGWQTAWYGGYKRVGKTAEDAMRVFRMAYEYQENGMIGMTIEMSSRELTSFIAKKLRVPVINIAAGDAADGSELVIYDLLGFQPTETMPTHAKYYATFLKNALDALAAFNSDVKNGAYPEEKHGWGMEPKEFDKFVNEMERKYPNVK
jgi:3-methyl-2-oxobutanoate hydroxymethyltransferase